MSSIDTRNIHRDSMFLQADINLESRVEPLRVKVRNLSAGGMMAESAVDVARGDRLTIDLRNIGKVSGTVAWVQGSRFGIAFEREIDPARARQHGDEHGNDGVVPARRSRGLGVYGAGQLRKI